VIASVVIVASAALLSILSSIAVQRFEDRQLRARIERRCDNVLSFLSEQLSPVGRSVSAFRILFENSKNVSCEEFERAAATLMEQSPEIGMFQWVPVVRAGGTRAIRGADPARVCKQRF
jgi:CHASE1-domain containing sensor protein